MPIIPARLTSILDNADELAPGRRKSSDGTYANKPGDHNVDYRGVVHAVDVSLSMPGTPYWEPRFQQFDIHAWQRTIAVQYVAASQTERSRRWPWLFDGGYMHAYDAARRVDIIFHPAVSLTWRVDNNPPSEHIQHGHFSIGHTVRSEQDTQPIFVEVEAPVTPAEIAAVARATRDAIFADARFDAKVRQAAEEAIAEKFSGYDERGKVGSLVIIRQRDALGIQPPHGG